MYEDLAKQLRFCSSAATCEGCPYGFGGCEEKLMKDAAKAIEDLSKNSPKHGKWCLDSEYEYIECSLCGGAFYTGADSTNEAKRFMENGYAPNYCPSCGADMRPRPKEGSR